MPSPSKPVPRGRALEARGDQRLAALLEALEQLLTQRPIAEIGIEDLTTLAGISRSAFYFYFASKNDALTALIGQLRDEMIEATNLLHLEPDDDPATFLQEGFQQVARIWLEHRHLLAAIIESGPTDPAMSELWSNWIEAFVPATATLIQTERDAGRAIPGPPAEELARALAWANERNFYRVLSAGPTPAEVDALIATLTTIWLGAIYRTP